MASGSEIQAWATGIGLPYCIGDGFQQTNGGNLPSSIPQLQQWGTAQGVWNNGAWTCKANWGTGPGNPGAPAPATPPSAPTTPTPNGTLANVIAWAQANPILAAGILTGIVVIVARK